MKKKSLVQNLFVYAVRVFVLSASPLFIFPYVSRVLGAQGVGEVQYAYSIACYFQLLSSLGIVSYGIREGTKRKNDERQFSVFCSEMVLINLISSTISLLIYLTVIFSVPALRSYRSILLLFVLYVFFAGITLDWFVNIREDFTYVTVRTSIFQFIVLILAFVFIQSRQDTLIYAAVLCLPSVFSSLANGIYLHKNVTLFPGGPYHLKQHIGPILFLFAILISGNVYSLLDSTMLGVLVGDEAVGLYKAASNYPRLIVQLITSLCAVFLPRLTYYIAQQNKEKFEQLFYKVGSMIAWLAVPCAVGLWVLSPEVVLQFNGEEYASAIPAMKILSANIIFSVFDAFLGWQVLVPLNKERFLMFATGLGAGADVILNCILIPQYGVIGAACATLLSELIVFVVCTASVSAYLSLMGMFQRLWKFLLAALAILFSRWMCGEIGICSPIPVMAFVVCLSAVLYTGILFLLKETLTREGATRVCGILVKMMDSTRKVH